MAASWGAYVFISNLIPMYVIALIVTKRCAHAPTLDCGQRGAPFLYASPRRAGVAQRGVSQRGAPCSALTRLAPPSLPS